MMTLVEFEQNQEIAQKALVLAYLASRNNTLNESVETLNEGLEEWFKKIGMELEKGKGIFSYIKQFSTGVGQILLHAIRKDEEGIKKAKEKFSKGELIDFLLKLDTLTLHMVTGPIHIIDSLTGWEIMAHIKSKIEKSEEQFDKFVKGIKTAVDAMNPNLFADAESAKIKNILDQVMDYITKRHDAKATV